MGLRLLTYRCAAARIAASRGLRVASELPLTKASAMAANWTEEMIELEPGMPARVYGRSASPRTAPLVLPLHGGAFVGGAPQCRPNGTAALAPCRARGVSAQHPRPPRAPL